MDYKIMDKYIADRLYEARVIKRITQEQITDKINNKLVDKDMKITRQTYSNYERGTFSIPQGILQATCEILGLDWISVFKEAQEYMFKEINK